MRQLRRALPYRQLRKTTSTIVIAAISALPYRQLRKMGSGKTQALLRALPYRQLRKLRLRV